MALRSLLILILTCWAGLSARAETRLALIIGNEDYPVEVGQLSNPHEDAEKIADALRQINFEIVGGVRKDATRDEIWAGVLDLKARLQSAGPEAVGFVYYSGHGGSHEASGIRSNYLIPARSPITAAEQLPVFGVSLKQVVGALDSVEAKAVFIVSDACRNTLPWTDNRGGAQPDRSFIAEPAGTGMLLAYSTADGETAPDDGLFANELARRLPQANLTADRLFTLVGREVASRRSGSEKPVVRDELLEDFCFAGCGPTNTSSAMNIAPAAEPAPTSTGSAGHEAPEDDVLNVEGRWSYEFHFGWLDGSRTGVITIFDQEGQSASATMHYQVKSDDWKYTGVSADVRVTDDGYMLIFRRVENHGWFADDFDQKRANDRVPDFIVQKTSRGWTGEFLGRDFDVYHISDE